jgi:hypothetical protein
MGVNEWPSPDMLQDEGCRVYRMGRDFRPRAHLLLTCRKTRLPNSTIPDKLSAYRGLTYLQ